MLLLPAGNLCGHCDLCLGPHLDPPGSLCPLSLVGCTWFVPRSRSHTHHGIHTQSCSWNGHATTSFHLGHQHLDEGNAVATKSQRCQQLHSSEECYRSCPATLNVQDPKKCYSSLSFLKLGKQGHVTAHSVPLLIAQ